MAIIQCYECKKEISDKATSCPNCGAPIKVDSISGSNNEDGGSGLSRSGAALIGFCIGFFLLYAGCGASAQDFVKPSSLIMGVIVGTFFAILFSLIFGRSK